MIATARLKQSYFKRLTAGLIAMVMLASGIVAVGPTSRSAEAASCRPLSTGTTSYAGYGENYSYTPTFSVPNWSSCKDINVLSVRTSLGESTCAWFRARLFPSSGGSYASGWREICGSSWVEVAYNVKNGTRYRVETHGSRPVYFTIYD